MGSLSQEDIERLKGLSDLKVANLWFRTLVLCKSWSNPDVMQEARDQSAEVASDLFDILERYFDSYRVIAGRIADMLVAHDLPVLPAEQMFCRLWLDYETGVFTGLSDELQRELVEIARTLLTIYRDESDGLTANEAKVLAFLHEARGDIIAHSQADIEVGTQLSRRALAGKSGILASLTERGYLDRGGRLSAKGKTLASKIAPVVDLPEIG